MGKERILLVETNPENIFEDNHSTHYGELTWEIAALELTEERNLELQTHEKEKNCYKEILRLVQALSSNVINLVEGPIERESQYIDQIWIIPQGNRKTFLRFLRKLDDIYTSSLTPKFKKLFREMKILEHTITTNELVKLVDNKEIFFSSRLVGDRIINLFSQMKNFKIFSHDWGDESEMFLNNPSRFIHITEALNNIKKEIISYTESGDHKPDNFKYEKQNSLLNIMNDTLYYDLNLETPNTQLLYVIGDSKILFDELVDILFKQEKDFHYQYEWDRIAKKFSTKCNKLLLINLEEINILKLNEIKDRILSWLNNKKKQIVILKGSRRGYELFRKLNFSLIELPTLGSSIQRVTQIFFYLLDRNKKTHYIENDNIIGYYNLLETLLKDFSSVDQMNELISQIQFNLSMNPVSWYNFLAGISYYEPELHKSVRSKDEFPKIFKFNHNDSNNTWEISYPDGSVSESYSYDKWIGIKYLLLIIETTKHNEEYPKIEEIVIAVETWYWKKNRETLKEKKKEHEIMINELKKFSEEKKKDYRSALRNKINENFNTVKNKFNALEELIECVEYSHPFYIFQNPHKFQINIDESTKSKIKSLLKQK